MNHRDKAVELLAHYFALAMGKKRGAVELPSDYYLEIAEIVDSIIAAAREKDAK